MLFKHPAARWISNVVGGEHMIKLFTTAWMMLQRGTLFPAVAASGDPTPGAFDYLRPDGTSYYNRPDGTSYYLRP